MNPLFAENFKKDPRIQQAKKLLLETVKEHQKNLTTIKPADPERKQSYEQLLNLFAKERGAKLFFPYIGSGFGNGALVELLDGSVKYDMISGIGVHHWGHSHPDLVAAGFDAALNDTVMQGNLQQNKEAIELSKILIEQSKLPHCFLTTSGVMANENALKIAFQKNSPANRVLAFDHCFAGRSLFFSQVTDKPAFREGLPLNVLVDYIPFFDHKRPEESTREAEKALRKYIQRYPKQHAIFMFELVQGEGGFNVAPRDFFVRLMSIAQENHIAIFADEVQSFGRTPSLFAFQHYKLEEYVDIAAVGKLSQVCATLFTEEYKPKPGLLSQTFTGSTSSILASEVIIKGLLKGDFFGPEGRMAEIHHRFESHLKKMPVEGPFGIGAMIAFTPFEGDPQKVNAFVQKLFEEGVITFVAGSAPTRVRMLVPAGVITDAQIDEVCHIIEKTLHVLT